MVCLAFDEIKVKSNLVFNKYNDELIGFVDLGDPELNYSTFTDLDQLPTHALVYYLREIGSTGTQYNNINLTQYLLWTGNYRNC